MVPLSDSVGKYEKFEIVVDLDADFSNPYDPDEIRLDAQFTSPSGNSVTVPGFYYRDFELDLSGVRDRIIETDDWSWRVRFAPNEVGEWSYVMLAAAGESDAISSPSQTFAVTESDERGFVRIDPRNPRYLAFDDGTPYLAVGENIGWYGSGGMVDYVTWLDAMHAAGGNFIRVWMAPWGFTLEWTDTGLGNYDARQDEAYKLDALMNIADERDIYIMLTLLNHGQYSTATNPEWDANPFNVANGGPLEMPADFATNPEAIRLWKQRLRYIAARWGYSTNLMAWEWWNEINWTALSNPDLLVPWVEISTAYLNTVDPYHHLTTHSGSAVSDVGVWEQMSFVTTHQYDMDDVPLELSSLISSWLEQYPDKPFLLGEFGISSGPSEFDLGGVLLHLGLWAAPMNGASGTGMTWWWDTYVHPNNLYQQFTPVVAFFEGEDLAAYDYHPTASTLNREARSRVFGMQTDQRALLWVVSKRYSENEMIKQYTKNLRDGAEDPFDISYPEVEGAILTLAGMADGEYTVEWWDTFTGQVAQTDTITISGGAVDVAVPTYSADWAVKVKPVK